VAIDLCQAGLLPHSLDSWVFVGPGAIDGIAMILGRRPTATEAETWIATARDHQNEMMAQAQVRLRGPRLTLENVEQALCEYQKYVGLRAGGRPQRRFDAPRPDDGLWDELPQPFAQPLGES
jgi:hypothetical protein